ncbi:YtzH-like family protein [Bacillus sp. FJAT-45350]|uniref:YtzH-like family protein n=1 Tax=Bacillus sp. FJAT-45350 TaxID=2011014 RepID=UPI000BB75ABC|nr:YtzH-like family protein [Bacillus sp. FJAT-45350]
MPLSNDDKLGLLYDILRNKEEFQRISPDEYDQITRLTNNLLQDQNLDPQLHQTLLDIQQVYGDNSDPLSEPNVQSWIDVYYH